LDKQDQNLEQQVWQRVRSCREEGPKNDLRQMQREALELAAIYRGLLPRMTGWKREQTAKLHQGERANAAALAGIGILSRQDGEQLKLWQPGNEDPKKLLQRCYHRTRRAMTEYTARSAEPEYGLVFEKLAKREGEHCVLLAEILGTMG
jgi:hypothetical protein